MTNIASVLKAEILRVARKEVRFEIQALKKSTSSYRSEIAALKRRAQSLELEVRRLSKVAAKTAPAVEESSGKSSRYSAKSLASQRRRLGLSANDCGLLVGASAQSIYNWEEGKVRPQAKHLAAIANLRVLGRRQIADQLESLKVKAG